MAFAHLTWREGLRDIVGCLNAQPEELHHLGFTGPLAKFTLADANESRDWRIWEGVAKGLIRKARRLYANEELEVDLDQSIYALDSSTVNLSLPLFPLVPRRLTLAIPGPFLYREIIIMTDQQPQLFLTQGQLRGSCVAWVLSRLAHPVIILFPGTGTGMAFWTLAFFGLLLQNGFASAPVRVP